MPQRRFAFCALLFAFLCWSCSRACVANGFAHFVSFISQICMFQGTLFSKFGVIRSENCSQSEASNSSRTSRGILKSKVLPLAWNVRVLGRDVYAQSFKLHAAVRFQFCSDFEFELSNWQVGQHDVLGLVRTIHGRSRSLVKICLGEQCERSRN